VTEASLIFLVGPRGSGKTSVARRVASGLGWHWLDADALLEERHGQTIKQIFAGEGEAGFRDKEAALVDDLCLQQRHVIATGGGVVLREENRRKLRAAGHVVWLTADARTLWARISDDRTTGERRPNLLSGGLAEVEEVLRMREPLYGACAHLRVETAGRTLEQVVEVILSHLREPA
jgi:shikimate kinase